jgi:hypothetical protein
MPVIVNVLPYQFVNYLTAPGLQVGDMNIPMKQYVSSNPNFGGNEESALVIGLANQKIFDDEVRKTKISAKTHNIGRLTTGQGYPNDFMLLMKHMADNMDRLKALPELKKKEYFKNPNLDTEAILNKMVEKKVFGLDCIGFVSQYLVHSGVWKEYKTYYPADYRREFTPVKSLKEVTRLCLLIWDNYHIAIIDEVISYDEKTKELKIDVCQSSSGEEKGPQLNMGVTLRPLPGANYQGAPKFKMYAPGSPRMPVTAPVYICKHPELVYQDDMVS